MEWDYLILTASNELQAMAYEEQLSFRKQLGLLHGFRQILVVPDPEGRRVGSGGSTIACLQAVLTRQKDGIDLHDRRDLRDLRILIIHAGGDSRRLPAYGQCGKIFVPLPGETDSPVATTLFDHQLPIYRELPGPPEGRGQAVIASGDVLVDFSARHVRFASEGITGLACAAPPEQAARHGVYCRDSNGALRRFLQKPSPERQDAEGAIDASGQSLLDVGVFEFDGATALKLLRWASEADQTLTKRQPHAADPPRIDSLTFSGIPPLDFYREICCGLGNDTAFPAYLDAVRSAGSVWTESSLAGLYQVVSQIPCRVHVLSRCSFLHFGTNRQIIPSGQELVRQGNGFRSREQCLSMNSRLADAGSVASVDAWIEGCTLDGSIRLGGNNVVVGVTESDEIDLPAGACLDLLPGRNRAGQPVTFVRCYRQDDRFDVPHGIDTVFCTRPLNWWIRSASMSGNGLWDWNAPEGDRTLWHARLFPAVEADRDYREWLWMLQPDDATPYQRQAWCEADRYSLAEMAHLADLETFAARRVQSCCRLVRSSLRRQFSHSSRLSAAELAYIFQRIPDPAVFLAEVLTEAYEHDLRSASVPVQEAFVPSRILHSLGAVVTAARSTSTVVRFPDVPHHLDADVMRWLARNGLGIGDCDVAEWADRLRAAAFEKIRGRIVASGTAVIEPPRPAIRRDEIVWGRIPARLDLAGGWTDTPPYALEHGGRVLNGAVLLNGQPPIQVYGRLTSEPLIRLRSIDVGSDLEIRRWEDLLDYDRATGEFSLVKAALVQCGFTPYSACGLPDSTLEQRLSTFGGGVELTTLAAIPKGSGLGTSSIMGAVVVAVIHRILGRDRSHNDLLHDVLRIEQALTTGGGWQDQVGGVVGGLKLISTEAAFVPETTIRFLPTDVLDPRTNGGCTLLYYTGITRLAKNILQEVVGRYLNRDREAMAVLEQLRAAASEVAEAVSRKDLPEFGRLVSRVWRLNVRLDPNSTSEDIEDLLDRARPHIWGGKLLGAGGGGFLLLICRSRQAAERLRDDFETYPPNELARFFDFTVCEEGLCVSVC